jgi:hypothetical protein
VKTFSSLKTAVRFIATAVEREDYDGLARACREPLPSAYVLHRLREVNADTPLGELYAGWKFPSNASHLKLGGHGRKFGHIHIDFERAKAGWGIRQIWMCR